MAGVFNLWGLAGLLLLINVQMPACVSRIRRSSFFPDPHLE
jgi:hypothetical protein